MSPTVVVETEDLAAAARSISVNVAQPMTASSDRLVCGLLDSGAMAGDDAAGTQWASRYDQAAWSALAATQDVVNGAIKLAGLFAQTARNYAAADSASTAGARPALSAGVADLPGPGELVLSTSAPSAAGGSGDTPTGWGLVRHLVGYVWPDGHQDRLRATAAVWRSAADALVLPANMAETAYLSAVADRLPEGDDMRTVCLAMYRRIGSLASAYRTLAQACDDYAHHLDEVHHEIIGELTSLVEWTAAIEGAGALFAVVTLGGSEAAAQAAESARIAVSASRIGAMIEKFIAAARGLAEAIPAVEQTLLEIRAGLEGLLGTRLAVAGVTSVRALPGTARTAKTIKTAHMTAEERLAAGAGRNAGRTGGRSGAGRTSSRESDAHAGRATQSSDGGVRGATGSLAQLGQRFGYTVKQVKKAIHAAKHRTPLPGNPDVVVDAAGEIYPVGRDGIAGDSIGNILDYLGSS
ncbi:MAG: hypothetical protein QOJ37_4201 [Pseudonocardiales bacterium]|nr:hypothetical protein [Pseudonocardiales bacterium]